MTRGKIVGSSYCQLIIIRRQRTCVIVRMKVRVSNSSQKYHPSPGRIEACIITYVGTRVRIIRTSILLGTLQTATATNSMIFYFSA